MPVLIKHWLTLSFIYLVLHTSNVYAKASQQQTKPLRIAVAANFAPALTLLLAERPNKERFNVQIISAATGTLFLQIKHGAPFDLFLSADHIRPQQLEQDHLIVPGSRKTYALGQIALWSATKQVTNLNILDNYAKKLAIANPDIAPYGKAAQQALVHLSVWQKLKNNLVTGININQTFQQVRSKAIPLGIVAQSQLVMNNYQGVLIPTNSYTPIAQQLVIIKSSQQVALAQQVSDFILQKSSQHKLQQLGYLPISSPIAQLRENK